MVDKRKKKISSNSTTKSGETEMEIQRVIYVLIISLKMYKIVTNLMFSVKTSNYFKFIRVISIYYT